MLQINSNGYQLANSVLSSSSSASPSPHFNKRTVKEDFEEDKEEEIGAEFESSRHFLMKPSAHFCNGDEEETTGGKAQLELQTKFKNPYTNNKK